MNTVKNFAKVEFDVIDTLDSESLYCHTFDTLEEAEAAAETEKAEQAARAKRGMRSRWHGAAIIATYLDESGNVIAEETAAEID